SNTPPDAIIHNSAIFPMTAETCYFLPLTAAANIPTCNVTGLFGLGTALGNMLTTNLQSQVTLVERSLAYLSGALQINRAQLAKIQENQIELGEELQLTQQALNATIPILNAHSNTINTLKSGTERLYTHFQHSFLYSAITRIFRNELTLEFLSPEDLNIIVFDVLQHGNLTFNSH
ncbi:unnamed protein product, partial [Adineta ricciae]